MVSPLLSKTSIWLLYVPMHLCMIIQCYAWRVGVIAVFFTQHTLYGHWGSMFPLGQLSISVSVKLPWVRLIQYTVETYSCGQEIQPIEYTLKLLLIIRMEKIICMFVAFCGIGILWNRHLIWCWGMSFCALLNQRKLLFRSQLWFPYISKTNTGT